MYRSYRLFASLLTAYNARYEYCLLSNSITSFTTINLLEITSSPIRLHSASSLQIPRSTARFNSLLPTVNVSPLKLHSVSINLYGTSNYNIFRNHLRIRLSPIKSPILLKYKNPYIRNSMYPTIVQCQELLFVALWFILRGDLLYVFPCVILLCFSVFLVLRLPRLGKRELILVLFVRLLDLCLFGFVAFLLILGSGKGYGL